MPVSVGNGARAGAADIRSYIRRKIHDKRPPGGSFRPVGSSAEAGAASFGGAPGVSVCSRCGRDFDHHQSWGCPNPGRSDPRQVPEDAADGLRTLRGFDAVQRRGAPQPRARGQIERSLGPLVGMACQGRSATSARPLTAVWHSTQLMTTWVYLSVAASMFFISADWISPPTAHWKSALYCA